MHKEERKKESGEENNEEALYWILGEMLFELTHTSAPLEHKSSFEKAQRSSHLSRESKQIIENNKKKQKKQNQLRYCNIYFIAYWNANGIAEKMNELI